MSTILDKIIDQKRIEVAALKELGITAERKIPVRSFKKQLNDKQMNIISEIKRASPSKGLINGDVDPVAQAKEYARLGASAISVLTDEQFFKGSMEDLQAVADAVELPILCKDFMIDELQIDEAYANGASIILLIVAALDDNKLSSLYSHAKSLDLEVLVEVHDAEEMERALKLNPEIVGVNNRNLKTFEVDLENTGKLASLAAGKDIIFISESGIKTRADVATVEKLGASCILAGETLMRADDLETTFHTLQVPFTKDHSSCS
ncbi:indole-3-glycerol phosphate synthase TrpC [Aciduricibacillus chroicocephali]|uniref:Indole-3-glycerol phosphate synthase n=1 Tax=Aciduricibacillus chroicocephali TaxID=3054939 RepID=A0ABY9KW89_9BACI|nr:indole-3-glycerol phosphate synthase TrpC [Bacillaceae bacterium 44XB]